MLRPSLTTAAIALLGASAMAQGDLKSRVMPITSPFRHAGVYHVATGTWTRNGALSNLTGPDTIYNNTCNTGYFSAQNSNEKWQHRSRVPTTAANGAPTTVNASDATKNDEAPGCDTSYVVNGFQIVYCTSRAAGLGNFNNDFEFANAYLSCGVSDMVPDQTFNVTGLPPGTPGGTQICWIVDIDLNAASASFTLNADQDGTWVGPSTSEQFGYSIGPTTLGITTLQATGPVLAGNFTWTGGPFVGPLALCSGTDGTIWDSPINLAEEGTGMSSNDFFRITGTGATVAAGCYYFGGTTIHSDFYLKLFSDAQCAPTSPMVQNCFPGTPPTTQICPCGQPNNPNGGCANFGAGSTSGAVLNATGTASLSGDTVVLVTSNHRPAAAITNVFFTGSGTQNTGVPHGAGVRCVTTALKRLYTGQTSGGTIARPGMGDPSITARCATLSVPISAGQTRHYFNLYRDAQAAGPCGNTASTVNTTNAGSITWAP
jgi:hypothetical protein